MLDPLSLVEPGDPASCLIAADAFEEQGQADRAAFVRAQVAAAAAEPWSDAALDHRYAAEALLARHPEWREVPGAPDAWYSQFELGFPVLVSMGSTADLPEVVAPTVRGLIATMSGGPARTRPAWATEVFASTGQDGLAALLDGARSAALWFDGAPPTLAHPVIRELNTTAIDSQEALDALCGLLAQLPNLRELGLWCYGEEPLAGGRLAEHLGGLTGLWLSGVDLRGVDLRAAAPALRHTALSGYELPDRAPPTLETLHLDRTPPDVARRLLDGCRDLRMATVPTEALDALDAPGLRALTLLGGPVDGRALAALAAAPHTLELRQASVDAPAALAAAPWLPGLRRLEFHGTGIGALALDPLLRRCGALQELAVAHGGPLGRLPPGLRVLGVKATPCTLAHLPPSVHTLALCDVPVEPGPWLSGLAALRLRRARPERGRRARTDGWVTALIEHLRPGLRALDLDADRLTAAELHALLDAPALAGLRWLGLHGAQVDGDALRRLRGGALPALRSLSFDGWWGDSLGDEVRGMFSWPALSPFPVSTAGW